MKLFTVPCKPRGQGRVWARCRSQPGSLEGGLGSVKEFKFRYHNKEAMLFAIDPYCGNLNEVP